MKYRFPMKRSQIKSTYSYNLCYLAIQLVYRAPHIETASYNNLKIINCIFNKIHFNKLVLVKPHILGVSSC